MKKFLQGAETKPAGSNTRLDAGPDIINPELLAESVLMTTPAVIYVFELKGKKNIFFKDGLKDSLDLPVSKGSMVPHQFLAAHMAPEEYARYLAEIFPGYTRLQDGELLVHEFSIPKGQMKQRWLQVRESVYSRNADGSPSLIFGIAADISESKQTEAEFQRSEEKYRTLVEQASDAIFVADQQGRFITVNSSGCKLSGYNLEELKTMTIYDLADPADLEREPFHLEELRRGKTVKTERIMRRRDQKPVEVEITARNLTDGRMLVIVRDITEKKKAERDLVRSESLFRNLTSNAPVAIFQTDLEGKCSYANEEWQRYTGLSLEESLGYGWIEALYHEDKEKIMEDWGKAVKEKRLFEGEFRYLGQGGEIKWMSVKAMPAQDADQSVYGYIGMATDITKRKKMEVDLADREIRLRMILANEPECVKLLSRKAEVVEMNPAGLAMIEAENLDMVKGQSVLNIVDKPFRAKFRKLTQSVFNGNPGKLEFRITGLKGSHRWLETHAVPLRNPEGEIISLLGVTRDITEVKEKNAALNQSLQRNTAFLNAIPDQIYMINREGVFLDYQNSAGSPTLRMPQEFLGKKVSESLPPDLAEITMKNLEMAMDTGNAPLHEYQLQMPDGPHDYEARYAAMNDKEALVIVRDVTMEKQARRQIELKEEKYRLTLERITDGFVALDTNWRYTYMNRKAGEIFGRNPEEMIGKHIWTEFPEGIGQPFAIAYEKAMQEQQYIYLEEYYAPYDTWFENHIYPSAEGLSIYFRNISHRKNAEKQILKEKELSDSVINSLPGVFYLCDKPGKFLRWNQNYETVTGYTGEEISRMHPLDFFDGDDKRLLSEKINNVFKAGEDSVEAGFLLKNGKKIPYLFTGRTIEYQSQICLMGVGIDISSRVEIQQALLKSEERYRSLIEQASDGILITTTEGLITEVNRSICNMTGFRSEELLGKNLTQLIPADDLIIYPLQLQELMDGRSLITQRRFLKKDGSTLETEVNSKKAGEGLLIGFIRDISERKMAEAALIESEMKYRNLVEQATDGIFIFDAAFHCTDVNSKGCAMLGYTRDELLTMTIGDLVVEQASRSLLQIPDQEEGKPVLQEVMLKNKAGEVIPFEINTRKIPDGHYLSFVRDISERRKADMERQTLLLRNQLTLRTMLDGFLLADDKGKIIEVNPAYCSMSGYTREELLASTINDIEASLNEAEIQNRIREMMEKGSLQFETMHRRKDQSLFEIEVSISIMIFDEKPLVAAFVRDITGRKKAEKQIREYNAQLQSLTDHLQTVREEERKRIGREIHDELGQQLTAVKMDVAWIEKKLLENETPVKEKIKNIINLLDESHHAIRRILSELRPGLLDAHGLVESIRWLANQLAESKGIEVDFDCPDRDPRLGEPQRLCLFRIFQEAFTNISRHADARRVFTSLHMKGDTVEVTIRDDGKGFDPMAIKNKKSFGILGIRERVHALGGHFKLVSGTVGGTLITVSIPAGIETIKPD